MFKKLSLSLAAATAVALPAAAVADDRIDIGGFGGTHLFSKTIELGVADTTAADSPEHSLAFGLRVGYRIWRAISAEAELAIAPTRTRDNKSDIVIFGWRTHALYHIEAGSLRPFLLGGVGALTSAPSDKMFVDEDTDALFHAGAGLKYDAAETWGLRVDARALFPPSTADRFATTDWELFLGAYKRFPTGADTTAAEPVDSDGDNVVGVTDLCPDEAEDVDGYQDADGCPDDDNDGDGVPDGDDPCPLEPGRASASDPPRACPIVDEDGDGLTDTDKCPAEPEDKDGHQDDDGCPDPDNDSDTIPDAEDKCATEAETLNGIDDSDGCPDELPADLGAVVGKPIEGIQFAGRTANLRPFVSKAALDKLTAVLKAHPEVVVAVVGYTDDQGDEAANVELSTHRAQAVVDHLVKAGLDAKRLQARGMGPAQPVADNTDARARKANNRIELEIVVEGTAP